jgi:thioredoxin 1
LVNALLIGVFGVLIYMVFMRDRSPDLSAETRIDLQELLSKRQPLLLEFGKGWCRPCKYMKPILEDTAAKYKGRATVVAVDMDANADLVRQFSIRVMPTQVFLRPDGREFFRNEGVLEREHIVQVFGKMGLEGPASKGS